MVLATENLGKVKEIQAFLSPLGITLIPQSDFQIPSIEETGFSFVENALLKARHAAKLSKLPALADDSGICVDALSGAPGIYSARYAGAGASMEANIQKLLSQTQHLAPEQRQARFYCALAFVQYAEDPIPLICQAQWEGQLLTQKIGEQGFGYDPIFWVPELNCSAAQLSPEQKNTLSHRAKALHLLATQLSSKFI